MELPPLTHAWFYHWLRLAAIGLLAACNQSISTDSPADSQKAAGATADLAQRCFFVGGGLSESDLNLMAATQAGDIGQIEQLLGAGANANATDTLKRTPLFAAAFCNHSKAVDLLADRGGDVNSRDFSGMSPLHAAVIMGAVDAVRALMAKGATLDIRDSAGRTPLHLAGATNQVGLVELLLEHGANTQVRDKNGSTAAFLASDNGHNHIAVAIRKWQAKQKAQSQKRG